VVITGPIFRADDPIYRNEHMDYVAAIPLRFWKVCGLVRQDGTIAATGFILGQQDITKLKGFEEAFEVDTAQVTIRELERLTGLGFGAFTENDHFAKSHEAGTLEVAGPADIQGLVKAIQSPEDIVI
jgi:endonuclease G, mitochondrial